MIRKIKNKGHLILALMASLLHGFPGRGIKVIAVTGTDGKTTTANLLYEILKEAGIKAAVISTIGAYVDGKVYETGFHVTTPSPFAVQKYIRLAKEKGCTHVILEVTSHAIDQNRVWGINFDISILTNITHEHLDYHKSYENYVLTKLRIFKKANIAIVNSNGEWMSYVTKNIPKDKMVTYSLHGVLDSDLTLDTIPFAVKTSLIGDFNLENILAASVAAMRLGVEGEIIGTAVKNFQAPIGRQQVMYDKDFTVMVDFAHTPNSFESILPEIRKRTTGGIIHVFGAAGERDSRKRPEMGKVAGFYDDIIILTAEDPRNEKVGDINKDIKKGINGFSQGEKDSSANQKTLYEIDDRRKAISFAITMAKPDDIIIVTGKGHEKSMNLGDGEIDWSDQKVISEILKKT